MWLAQMVFMDLILSINEFIFALEKTPSLCPRSQKEMQSSTQAIKKSFFSLLITNFVLVVGFLWILRLMKLDTVVNVA